jgi:hypothetical protein
VYLAIPVRIFVHEMNHEVIKPLIVLLGLSCPNGGWMVYMSSEVQSLIQQGIRKNPTTNLPVGLGQGHDFFAV